MSERFKGTSLSVDMNEPDVAEAAATTAGDGELSVVTRELHRAFSRALQARIANHGVSMGQWYFLRALWDEDGLTQRELSQRVGMMEPTTVTALNSLERHDLVRRVRNPYDRRKVNIFLTPKGRALRDDLLPEVEEIGVLATRSVSSAEVAMTIAVLRRVSLNLGTLPALNAAEGAGERE